MHYVYMSTNKAMRIRYDVQLMGAPKKLTRLGCHRGKVVPCRVSIVLVEAAMVSEEKACGPVRGGCSGCEEEGFALGAGCCDDREDDGDD